ncbi:MAG TPA: hypothetical protein VFK14_01655 [Solirubrobacterales bacterium]|nr:hypothetical protein [Solirubrobacterales bacterium]
MPSAPPTSRAEARRRRSCATPSDPRLSSAARPERALGADRVAGPLCARPTCSTAPVTTPIFNSGLLEPEFALPSPNYRCASDQLQVITYVPGGPITLTDAIDFTVALP